MKIAVFASTKGGVGKTTLAFATAVELARQNTTVFLADVDPQRSLTRFSQLREVDVSEFGNPMLLDNVGAVGAAALHLEKTGHDRDWMVVDTPGSHMPIVTEAVSAADVVIVPIQASAVDLLGQEDVFDLIHRLQKMNRVVIVQNRADDRISPSDGHDVAAFAQVLRVPFVKVKQRLDYVRAIASGRSGNEINGDAAQEITALVEAIQEVEVNARQTAQRRNAEARRRGPRVRP